MSNISSEQPFSFSLKDFRSCTHSVRDAQYLHSRFKDLKKSIINSEIFKYDFSNFKGKVSHPYNRGYSQYYDYHWIGFADNSLEKIQNEVQLQVGISRNRPLDIELFTDQSAREARRKARLHIEANKDIFLKLINELPNYHIGIKGKINFSTGCKHVDDTNYTKIVSQMGNDGVHFFIKREIQKSTTISLHEQIVSEIVCEWLKLQPLYYLLTFGRIGYDSFKSKINDFSNSNKENSSLKKQFTTKEISTSETEAEATERESNQITYEQNYVAQEKANSLHIRTVNILAQYLKAHKGKPVKSVIDVFVENNDRVFIFEVKSIHSNNTTFQTRMAIGQLLDYEFFQIKRFLTNKDKAIYKGIVYSKKPRIELISFLKTNKISVFWIENEYLSGNHDSLQVLDRFLSST
jgi:hypothetical protein